MGLSSVLADRAVVRGPRGSEVLAAPAEERPRRLRKLPLAGGAGTSRLENLLRHPIPLSGWVLLSLAGCGEKTVSQRPPGTRGGIHVDRGEGVLAVGGHATEGVAGTGTTRIGGIVTPESWVPLS